MLQPGCLKNWDLILKGWLNCRMRAKRLICSRATFSCSFNPDASTAVTFKARNYYSVR